MRFVLKTYFYDLGFILILLFIIGKRTNNIKINSYI